MTDRQTFHTDFPYWAILHISIATVESWQLQRCCGHNIVATPTWLKIALIQHVLITTVIALYMTKNTPTHRSPLSIFVFSWTTHEGVVFFMVVYCLGRHTWGKLRFKKQQQYMYDYYVARDNETSNNMKSTHLPTVSLKSCPSLTELMNTVRHKTTHHSAPYFQALPFKQMLKHTE